MILLNLILIFWISSVNCQYEVGVKYNYLFKSKSIMTTQPLEGTQRIQPIDFSCLSSIECTSIDEEGFQFELSLTGIRIIQRDSENNVVDVVSSVAMNQAYNRPFVFTILKSGLIDKVKCPADEDEEIMRIKSAIIAQFITLGEENEADESHVETLDNQGIYLSHWKRKRGREKEDVELTREYTDEDFIFFRDRRTNQHTCVMRVSETKKMKKGILTNSGSENSVFLAGKEYRNAKRKLARKNTNKRKLYNGLPMEDYKFSNSNESDDDPYNGTSITTRGTATLTFVGSIDLRGSKGKKLTSNEAESESERRMDLKPVPYLTRDYYAPRVQRRVYRKASQRLKSNLGLGKQMDDLTDWDVISDEEKAEARKYEELMGEDDDLGLGDVVDTLLSLCNNEDASLTDSNIVDGQACSDSKKNSRFGSKRLSFSNSDKNEDNYTKAKANSNTKANADSGSASKRRSFTRELLARTTRAPSSYPSPSSPSLSSSSSNSSPSSSSSSSPSSSLLGTQIFTGRSVDAGNQQSNGLLSKVECPDGLDRCYRLGGSQTMGNNDFGGYFGAFVLAGAETNCGLDCNFQIEAKGAATVNILGRKLTLFALSANIARIDGFSRDNHIAVQLFTNKLECCWKDIACKTHPIELGDVSVPIVGFEWELDFYVIKIEFKTSVSVFLALSVEVTVCIPEGYGGVALVPTLGVSAGAGAFLRIGKCPFCVEAGIGLNASTDVSFIPQGAFDLNRRSLVFSGNLRWNPLQATMKAHVKVGVFKKKEWKLFDWKLKEITKTVFEMAFALPWINVDAASVSNAASISSTSTVTHAEAQALHALVNEAYGNETVEGVMEGR